MARLPADVCYCLDSAVELGLITSDINTFLMVYHHDPVTWHDSLNNGNYFDSLRTQSRIELASWRAEAPLEQRAAVSWSGLLEVQHQLVDSARHVLSAAIKMSYDGHAKANDAIALTDDLDFVYQHANPLIPNLSEIMLRVSDDVRIMGNEAFISARNQTSTLFARERIRRSDLIQKHIDAGPRPESRKRRKAKRKPLLRSVEFLTSIVGNQKARAFINGDDITVEGKEFNFRVRKGVLLSNSHGGINITVTDKSHIELVDLCFYFQDMPAPDQMAALVMHVQAGNEDQIIKTGNIIRSHDSASSNGALHRLRDMNRASKTMVNVERDDMLDSSLDFSLDDTLFGGRRGSGDLYRELHDDAVPRIMDHIRLAVMRQPGMCRLQQVAQVVEDLLDGVELFRRPELGAHDAISQIQLTP